VSCGIGDALRPQLGDAAKKIRKETRRVASVLGDLGNQDV
jgi:hypothetical protein